MSIREDIDIKGSDGNIYRYDKRVNNYRNVKTGRLASSTVKYDLDGIVIERRYVKGETIFKELLEISRISGYKDPEWQRSAIKDMERWSSKVIRPREKSRVELLRESEFRSGIRIGRPCMFFYEAKGRDKLPYWDKFPVIIPIKKGEGYFIGLNVHYLSPDSRAILLDSIYSIMLRGHKYRGDLYEKARLGNVSEGAIYDRTAETYLDISYSKLMREVGGIKYFKPTIHKYLTSQVKSRVIEITPRGWTMCMFLPTAKFVKKSEGEVWRESEKKARK